MNMKRKKAHIDESGRIRFGRIETIIVTLPMFIMGAGVIGNAYMFSDKKIAVRGEYGELPPKMENFIKNLMSTASELKFTQEITE